MQNSPDSTRTNSFALASKLWIYTNYDCNIQCSYCVAESGPQADRRSLPIETVRQIVDEGIAAGFEEIFFTGGEPLILPEIYLMLAYSAERVRTILLTNAMLIKGKRLEKLVEVARRVPRENLVIQVSLDGGRAEHHEAYRGTGSWAPTIAGIKNLLENNLQVRLSTTETPANSAHLAEICEFHESLGIPHTDHIIRPLARSGFSQEGLQIDKTNLAPELTVDVNGVYWHPLSTDTDMLVSKSIFPLSVAVNCVQEQLAKLAAGEELSKFT